MSKNTELEVNNSTLTQAAIDAAGGLTTHSAADNGIDGLIPEDTKEYGVSLPNLKLVDPMSKEGKQDPSLIGSLLYDKRLDLGQELSSIVLATQWRWQEKREYDPSNLTPLNIMTNEELLEAGLDKEDVVRLCIVNLAVVLPDGIEDETSISAGGIEYVLCSFWARGFSLDFAKAIARKINLNYGGASYNKFTKMMSSTRAWKGDTMRLVKWGGAGPSVSPETLETLAKEIGGLG